MRATQPRSWRTLAVALALALGLSIPAAATLAKPAPISYGYGSDPTATATTGAIGGTVKAGEVAAFSIWARNDGPTTNIPQFYLTANTTGTFYAALTSKGTCEAGPSNGSAMVCSFGSLAPGEVVYVTAGFTTPAPPPTRTSMTVDFEWSTVGYVDGGNRSRGNSFKLSDSVQLSNDAHYDGRVAFDDSLLTTLTTQVAGLNVSLLQGEIDHPIALELRDGVDVQCTPNPIFSCPSFVGDGVYVNVDNGTTFGELIYTQWIINGVQPNQITGVYHSWTDEDGEFHQLLVTDQFAPGTTPTVIPSFSVAKVGPQATQITFVDYHNGSIRGY
jgi:hypothetical protein